MMVIPRLPRVSSVCLLLCLVVLAGMLPAVPLAAQSGDVIGTLIDFPISTKMEQFESGIFYRTALFREPGTPLEEPDGTIELARIGQLPPFKNALFELPIPLYKMGAATFGRRIYLFGGRTTAPDGNSDIGTDLVWSGVISDTRDQVTNNLTGLQINGGWRAEPSLPATTGMNEQLGEPYSLPVTSTFDMAVTTAAAPEGSGNNYIYVLGGRTSGAVVEHSLATVRIAIVNPSTGAINDWITSDDVTTGAEPDIQHPLRIPGPDVDDPTSEQFGLAGAMATTVNLTGTTYLYLMGGVIEYRLGFNQVRQARKQVFYARVGEDGRLYKPGTTGTSTSNVGWGQLDDLPLPAEAEGLANAMPFIAESITGEKILYLVGGLTVPATLGPAQYTAAVYRARINADGTLDWQEPRTLPIPLFGHAGVELENRVYVLGGITDSVNEVPLQTGYSGYLEDTLDLHNFADSINPSYFEGLPASAPSEQQPLRAPRAYHAVVKVDAEEGSRFVYVLGGFDAANQTGASRARKSVYVYATQNLNDEEIQQTPYVGDGWYVSKAFKVGTGAEEPRIRQIIWNANFPPGGQKGAMELQMQYRIATIGNTDPECAAPTWSDWKADDAGTLWDSEQGRNEQAIDEPGVRCFQYRVRMFASGDRQSSPQLKDVNIKLFVPGSPDVHVDEEHANSDDGFVVKWKAGDTRYLSDFDGIDIWATNEYTGDPLNGPTLNANVVSDGQFYADLFVVGPGFDTQVVTPTLPLTGTTYVTGSLRLESRMYRALEKEDFPKEEPYLITSNSWCMINDPADPGDDECGKDIRDLFIANGQHGDFTVCVAIDSYVDTPQEDPLGLLEEVLPGGEDNNFSCTEFTIEEENQDPPMTAVELTAGTVITEGAALESMLTISIDSRRTRPVTISFSLEGTADSAFDYSILQGTTPVSSTVIIPTGETSITLGISTVTDEEREGDETVVLEIQPDDGNYTLNTDPTKRSITVTILDQTAPPTLYLPILMRGG